MLYQVSSGALDTFITNKVQPDAKFLEECAVATDKLVNFLQHNAPGELRPIKVIKVSALKKMNLFFCLNIIQIRNSTNAKLNYSI